MKHDFDVILDLSVCSVCCQKKGCAFLMFRGLDKIFGNFETKTKTELVLWGRMDDRCSVDSLMYLGSFGSFQQ